MMNMLDIAVPVLMVVAAIAIVAAVYFVATGIKDRQERRREAQLAARARARQQRPRRADSGNSRGAHMR